MAFNDRNVARVGWRREKSWMNLPTKSVLDFNDLREMPTISSGSAVLSFSGRCYHLINMYCWLLAWLTRWATLWQPTCLKMVAWLTPVFCKVNDELVHPNNIMSISSFDPSRSFWSLVGHSHGWCIEHVTYHGQHRRSNEQRFRGRADSRCSFTRHKSIQLEWLWEAIFE